MPRAGPPTAVKGMWERIKTEEKAAKAARKGQSAPSGALAGVPVALPALTRALKLQDKAGAVGFDWNDPKAVLAKIREEADEIEQALDQGDAGVTAEVGDLLFAAVNLARHLKADPESLLRGTNQKFERRFAAIEQALAARGKKRRRMRIWRKWTRSGTRPRPQKRPSRPLPRTWPVLGRPAPRCRAPSHAAARRRTSLFRALRCAGRARTGPSRPPDQAPARSPGGLSPAWHRSRR